MIGENRETEQIAAKLAAELLEVLRNPTLAMVEVSTGAFILSHEKAFANRANANVSDDDFVGINRLTTSQADQVRTASGLKQRRSVGSEEPAFASLSAMSTPENALPLCSLPEAWCDRANGFGRLFGCPSILGCRILILVLRGGRCLCSIGAQSNRVCLKFRSVRVRIVHASKLDFFTFRPTGTSPVKTRVRRSRIRNESCRAA